MHRCLGFSKLLFPTGALVVAAISAVADRGFAVAADVESLAGAVIYRDLCADCHGADGQGIEGRHDGPLFGDESIQELSARIEETMPEEDPTACVGEEATLAAEYIYQAFYSPAARQRNGHYDVPRIELARLTEAQHRNAVADLLLQFTRRGEAHWEAVADSDSAGGLEAQYYQSDGMNKAHEKKLQRVDAVIDFDYGTDSAHESIAADQFLVLWSGSLLARHSGDHDFRIRTPNGARLYLNHTGSAAGGSLRDDRSGNDPETLIDMWVGSGELREETGRIYLLGGRRYPLRVEFFKYKDKQASIQFEWKPPHGVWSVVPADVLSPEVVSRTFVVDAPFPPDDRSEGYLRGSDVSPAWVTAVGEAALAAADEVVDRLAPLDESQRARPDSRETLIKFVRRFAGLAYRRGLTDAERGQLSEDLFAGAPSDEAAVRSAVLRTLTSPSFLYVNFSDASFESPARRSAARLSLALWDSIPDDVLIEAASNGELNSDGQLRDQAQRMLRDPRARAKMRRFFEHWLEIEDRSLAKDKQLFPEFDEAVIADLRRSLELFLEQVVWSDASDYRELLLADYLLLNERLAKIYAEAPSADEPGPTGFGRYDFAGQHRAGVLTHPYLLSAQAYHNNTSPIHRGVFLTRNIVGRRLKPPPAAVTFEDAAFAPELTMREKVTQLTRDRACMACHSVINPLGFVLESYDAVGRWRTQEKEKPIDARSAYVTTAGNTLELTSARDLAHFAAASSQAQQAFVKQLFQHVTKQNPAAYGPDVVESLREQFAVNDFNIQRLMVEIAVVAAKYDREISPTSEEPSP